MDQNEVAVGAKHLPQLGALNTAEEIENYMSNFLEFLEDLIKRTVPAANDTVGYSCPWWTQEVEEEVQAARAVRRQGTSTEELWTIN